MTGPNFYMLNESRTAFYAFEDGSLIDATTVRFLEESAAAVERVKAAPPTPLDPGMARYLAATGGKSCVFTLAELRRWTVDRSSGYLKTVRAPARARRHAPATAPASGPDHAALIRELLDWIDGRACDPGIVARAAALVGRPAMVHAAAE